MMLSSACQWASPSIFTGQVTARRYVSTKALISFTSGTTAYSNTNLTASDFGQPVIAALWDDWATNRTTTDRVYYQTTGVLGSRVFTVQWQLNPYGGSGEISLQAQLFEATGQISLNYSDMETDEAGKSQGASATVGIQDSARASSLQWSYNAALVTSGTSVVFMPPQNGQQTWRQTHFGTPTNTGNAADSFDFDNDGLGEPAGIRLRPESDAQQRWPAPDGPEERQQLRDEL
jgi:hypothetical protein